MYIILTPHGSCGYFAYDEIRVSPGQNVFHLMDQNGMKWSHTKFKWSKGLFIWLIPLVVMWV
jgi:hypothetical protein